jgi:hypothetical protein
MFKYLYMCVCMCPLLGPELFDGLRSNLAFMSLSLIDRCPVNMSILIPRIGALRIGPKHIKLIFSKADLTNIIKFQ